MSHQSGLVWGALLLVILLLGLTTADHHQQQQQQPQQIQPTTNEVAGVLGAATAPHHQAGNHPNYPSYPAYVGVHPNPYRTYPVYPSNRDSYANAASDFGYNSVADSEPNGDYSQTFLSEYGNSDDGGGLGGIFGGLGGGLGGLLGIKGLKGLGIIGLIKVGIPILGLLALPILLLAPLILLFLPVPVITIPTPARALRALGITDVSGQIGALARKVANSEQCIERVSCEMSRLGKGTFVDRTLKKLINKIEPHLPKPLKRMAKVYMQRSVTCRSYSCQFMEKFGNNNVN